MGTKLQSENELTILVRCSDDFRVFDLLRSIDYKGADLIVCLTPNFQIQSILKDSGINYVVSPKGNFARTTLSGLEVIKTSKVLLVDSDCEFFPNSIQRLSSLAMRNVDIVCPNVVFESKSPSSFLTNLQRTFQYESCGYVYEPGLLINLKTLLPKVGGYLFSEYAPFTPDGELDFRIRHSEYKITIVRDNEATLLHKSLKFTDNIKSNWRYGYSDALVTEKLQQDMLKDFTSMLKSKYKSFLSFKYHFLTVLVSVSCDFIYLISLLWHIRKIKQE
ncbi:MAG TPA: glycosyltransferase [Pyrinomonadaceae bacterium]|jgi:hypothetical protein